jgi:hypothetical protein
LPDIFQQIVDGGAIELWVQETLRDWFPVYLPELEIQKGLTPGEYPLPRAYVVSETGDKEAGDQLPAVAIISPGLTGDPPLQEGDGTIRASWHVGVGVYVSARDRDTTREMGRIYCAVVRSIILQHQSLGKRAAGVRWVDESYDDEFQFVDRSTITFGQVIFEVEVAGVVNAHAGPTKPPDPVVQPGQQQPVANEVIIDEIRREPTYG